MLAAVGARGLGRVTSLNCPHHWLLPAHLATRLLPWGAWPGLQVPSWVAAGTQASQARRRDLGWALALGSRHRTRLGPQESRQAGSEFWPKLAVPSARQQRE